MVERDISNMLNDGEALEPLDAVHYIIQPKYGYRFGSDAVGLAAFAQKYVHKKSVVYDLCSGCGIIGITLALGTGCTLKGFELDEKLCDMSNRSCAVNGLGGARFVNADIREIEKYEPRGACDAVVCNPPFYKAESAPRKVAPQANSELTVKLGDVVRAAEYLLKFGGALYLVHTVSRLDEVMEVCRGLELKPKELVINKNLKTFMLKSLKGGNDGLTVRIR